MNLCEKVDLAPHIYMVGSSPFFFLTILLQQNAFFSDLSCLAGEWVIHYFAVKLIVFFISTSRLIYFVPIGHAFIYLRAFIFFSPSPYFAVKITSQAEPACYNNEPARLHIMRAKLGSAPHACMLCYLNFPWNFGLV